MAATSKEERSALLQAMPYKSVVQRIALINAVLATVSEEGEIIFPQGYLRPAGLLCHVLDKLQGSRGRLETAVEKLAKKPAAFGAKGGELGAAMLFEMRRKKFVRWVPPGMGHFVANRLTLEHFMEALATNVNGQRVPAWLVRHEIRSLDDFRDPSATLKLFTSP